MENKEQYAIPEANLPTFNRRIEKLNKRARKLGVPEIQVEQIGIEDRKVNKDSSATYRVIFVKVFGAAPKIAGWTFIATIHPVSDENGALIGNEVRPVPGQEIPAQYRNATLHCDHCHTDRRRNDVFVVRNEAGETKQIGRNCLRDFLGHTNPEMYAALAEMIRDAHDFAEDSEEYCGGGHGKYRVPLDEVLTKSACLIRCEGWLAKSKAGIGESCTSSEVFGWLFDPKWRSSDKWHGVKPQITEADKHTADEVEEWLQAIDPNTDNDYMYNLSLLGRAKMIEQRQVGIAASAISSFLREQEREINRRKLADLHKASAYVGELKQRLEFNLTLEFTREYSSDFGVTTLYKFVDESSNVIVWWSSNNLEIEVGQTVTVKATIKKHEERDGIKQTVVTRGKLLAMAPKANGLTLEQELMGA